MQMLTTLTDKEFDEVNCGDIINYSNTLLEIPKELKDTLYQYIKDCNWGIEDLGVYPVIYSLGASKVSIETGIKYFDLLGIPSDNIVAIDYPDESVIRIDSTILSECISIVNNPELSNSMAINLLSKNIKVSKFNTTKLVYGFIPYMDSSLIVGSKSKRKINKDKELNYFNIGE